MSTQATVNFHRMDSIMPLHDGHPGTVKLILLEDRRYIEYVVSRALLDDIPVLRGVIQHALKELDEVRT